MRGAAAELALLQVELEAQMSPDELARHRVNVARLAHVDDVVGLGASLAVLSAALDRFLAGEGHFVGILEQTLDAVERA